MQVDISVDDTATEEEGEKREEPHSVLLVLEGEENG